MFPGKREDGSVAGRPLGVHPFLLCQKGVKVKIRKKITAERSVYVQPGVCDFPGLFSANKLFYVQPRRQSDSLC